MKAHSGKYVFTLSKGTVAGLTHAGPTGGARHLSTWAGLVNGQRPTSGAERGAGPTGRGQAGVVVFFLALARPKQRRSRGRGAAGVGPGDSGHLRPNGGHRRARRGQPHPSPRRGNAGEEGVAMTKRGQNRLRRRRSTGTTATAAPAMG